MIKNHVKNLKISSTLRINEISKDLEAKGKKIFKFGFGQSPFEIPENIILELKNNANKNKYLAMQGLLDLRREIANYSNKKNIYNYKPENILIGPGSKELMFLLNIAFDGDIILPIPSWVSYEPQATLGYNKIHWIETEREKNWFPSVESIEKIILKNKNKNYLLFLKSPNNPSGQICENLEEIANLVRKYKVLVLSDEIYSELSFSNEYKSIANFCPENTIISSGLSKWCAAGGWRLGYFIIPNELRELGDSLKVLASETFSSVSAPVQYAAVNAYKNNLENYLEKSRNILKIVGEFVYQNLKSNKVLINKPQGGFYIMPEFLDKKFSSSEQMCNDLLNKKGVAILPGSDFGFKKNNLIDSFSFTYFYVYAFMNNFNINENNEDLLSKYAPNIIEGTKRLKDWVESN